MIGLHSKWIKRTHPKSAEESDAEWVPTMAKGSKPDKAWVTLRQSILRFCISFVLPAYLYFRQVYMDYFGHPIQMVLAFSHPALSKCKIIVRM